MATNPDLCFERDTNISCNDRNGGMFARVFYRTGSSLHAPLTVQLGKVIPDISQPLELIKHAYRRWMADENRQKGVRQNGARIEESQIVGMGLMRLCHSARHTDPPKNPSALYRLEGAGGILVAKDGAEPIGVEPLHVRAKRHLGQYGIGKLQLPGVEDISIAPVVFLSPLLLPTDKPIEHAVELQNPSTLPIYGAISENIRVVYEHQLWPDPDQ